MTLVIAVMPGVPGSTPCECNGPATEVAEWTRHSVRTYSGVVLEDRERNGYDDSDFYCLVWDHEAARPITIEYDSTRFGGSICRNASRRCGSHVDATPEVWALYDEWRRRQSLLASYRREVDEVAVTPVIGARVQVVRGRKIPVGTEATVVWVGMDRYRSDRYRRDNGTYTAYRVGLRLGAALPTDEVLYTSASNLDIYDPGLEVWLPCASGAIS